MEQTQTPFDILSKVDVSDHTEKKNGLTYLSWAWAWGLTKSLFPSANFTIYNNAQGWNYHTDGRTAWVEVGVTIEGLEHREILPVMDYRNQSLPLDKITSFNVNTAIQRCLAKAIALHGLGLSIYAGEDLGYLNPDNYKKTASVESAEDYDLLTALDEVRNITSRKQLEECYHAWSPYYYKDGTAPNGAFIAALDAKAAEFPKPSKR